MAEKTEKATPKKLKDAMKKGQVAKSQDLPSAVTFMASVLITLALADFLYHRMAFFLTSAFKQVAQPDLTNVITNFFFQAIVEIFVESIPILGLVVIIGVLINFLAVGPVFSPEVFKFDPKKFNPVDNLKAKFKMKTLIEALKNTLKIGIAIYIVYLVMLKSIPVLVMTVSLPITASMLIFHAFLLEVVIKIGLFFLAIAAVDFIYQKRSFAKEMKMDKFEVKQEYKNTEGDPLIKGKRKQIAHEIAYQEGVPGGVKRAQAVVTNPTHLAIAVCYKRDLDVAPYISAMGEGLLAERIIKLAEEYNIPIVRNIPIAHRLWDDGDVYQYVPEDTYEALAEVLRWVASLQEENV